MKKILQNNRGFTLSELLVAMVVSGIVVAGTVAIFTNMVRNYNTEHRILSMQQNLRSTMDYLERYIRMAGYDPSEQAGAGFETMLSNQIRFTLDKGRPDAGTGIDQEPNGVIDDHWEEQVEFILDDDFRLHRINAGGTRVLLANNIEVINFIYLDEGGDMTTNAQDVRSVQVTLVGRVGESAGFTNAIVNNRSYSNQQGIVVLPAPNDDIRRLMLSAEVMCRNM